MQVWLELANLPAKSRFRKQPGGTNYNAERQFITFSRSGQRLFQKYPSLFEIQSVFIKSPRITQLTFVYLWQLMLSQKALRLALCCPLYGTLGIKTLHMHSCSTLFWLEKKTLLDILCLKDHHDLLLCQKWSNPEVEKRSSISWSANQSDNRKILGTNHCREGQINYWQITIWFIITVLTVILTPRINHFILKAYWSSYWNNTVVDRTPPELTFLSLIPP